MTRSAHHRKQHIQAAAKESTPQNEEERKIQFEIDMVRNRMKMLQVRVDHKDISPLSFYYQTTAIRLELHKLGKRAEKLERNNNVR